MSTRVSSESTMPSLIQRIATGPKLSKDLARDEARRGLEEILSGSTHPAQSAIFFIALRMKRESDDENLGMHEALLDASRRAIAEVPLLVDISEPYDGFSKVLPITAFLPAVLAACGVPALSHGVTSMGPKYGVTHAQVLSAAGVDVELDCEQVCERLENPELAWCYIDQSRYCPRLFALRELRHLMVKRTALSTLERVLAPVRARGTTHLLAGYVHTAYPRVYAALARAAGFDGATLVRGSEGGVVPSLRQQGQAYRAIGDRELEHLTLDPAQASVIGDSRGVSARDDEPLAGQTARVGRMALEGQAGGARDALIYSAAITLWQLGISPSLAAAAERARAAIDDGDAIARLEAARCRSD